MTHARDRYRFRYDFWSARERFNAKQTIPYTCYLNTDVTRPKFSHIQIGRLVFKPNGSMKIFVSSVDSQSVNISATFFI